MDEALKPVNGCDDEEWRDIAGYEGWYQVSSLGRVRSVDRIVPRKDGSSQRLVPGKVLKLKDRTREAPVANLNKDFVRTPHHVDTLVAKAFIGDAPGDDMVLVHISGDMQDCSASNLRWDVDANAVLPDEEWRDVIGYEGLYEVSSLGRVKSVGRTGVRVDGSEYPVKGCFIKQRPYKCGYNTVLLHRGADVEPMRVDVLVANAFIGIGTDDEFIDHINGDVGDSRVCNLRWVHKDDYAEVILGNHVDDNEPEEWRDIEGYEGRYQVSSLGRVKRLSRSMVTSGGSVTTVREAIKKQNINNNGRLMVSLVSSDGERKTLQVHRLVAKAFLENPDNLEQVDHINSIATDNRVTNLRWCSPSENMRHCVEFRKMKRLAKYEPDEEPHYDEIDGEEWRDIPGTDGVYQVSNLGRVRSMDRLVGATRGSKRMCRGRIMRQNHLKSGYSQVHLSGRSEYVHRLVAMAFIDNPDNLPFVNHINGDKSDNRVENLEWCTQLQNVQHAIRTGRLNISENSRRMWASETGAKLKERLREMNSRRVRRSDGEVFESIRAAADALDVDKSCVGAVLSGKSKTCKGYTFEYVEKGGPLRRQAVTERLKVAQVNAGTNELVRIYDNVHEAIAAMDNTGIPNCLRGASHTCAGYEWYYAV